MDGGCAAEIDEGQNGGDDERHEDCIERDVPAVVDLPAISCAPRDEGFGKNLREPVYRRMGAIVEMAEAISVIMKHVK